MPRNPHKSRCQFPGCRSWAMRGDVHCRAHRDAELGPRGGGAPPGNLNALKTGEHSFPLDHSDVERIAYQVTTDPACFPDLLAGLARDLHARTKDIGKTVAALSALFRHLAPAVADARFSAEIDAFLLQAPPEMRPKLQVILWRNTLRLPPGERLAVLRVVTARFLASLEKSSTGKTKPGA